MTPEIEQQIRDEFVRLQGLDIFKPVRWRRWELKFNDLHLGAEDLTSPGAKTIILDIHPDRHLHNYLQTLLYEMTHVLVGKVDGDWHSEELRRTHIRAAYQAGYISWLTGFRLVHTAHRAEPVIEDGIRQWLKNRSQHTSVAQG